MMRPTQVPPCSPPPCGGQHTIEEQPAPVRTGQVSGHGEPRTETPTERRADESGGGEQTETAAAA
jgi:hypothetical protein